jgi:uncharacterized 2Fe-2S/4Fe-4S cluster protein (DUF4445 family)
METNLAQEPTHRILFEPSGKLCDVEDSQTVLDAARHHGVFLQSDCGGEGSCGKCVISAHPRDCLSPINEEERSLLSPEQLFRGDRLACQGQIKGPGIIRIPGSDRVDISAKTAISGTFPADPAVKRIFIHELKLRPVCEDLTAAVRSVSRALTGADIRFEDVTAVRELSNAVKNGGPMTLVCHRERGVTSVLTGERNRSLGIAVDVGTTTLALYLCDLQTGALLSSAGAGNPQRLFGEDVISRIAYADNDEQGTGTLHRLVVEKINELAGNLLKETGSRRDDVDEMVVVGNTTMETLLASFHPHNLGVSPYLPPLRIPGNFKAQDLGIGLNPGTNVHLFPVISGFLGGDAIGAILSEQPHRNKEVCLIVDIGTNGEIVLGNRDALWAASCATGPALEGAHISCGMRAAEGAIHMVDIDPRTLHPFYEVLGDTGKVRPQGICGSGIIDTMAAMRRTGFLMPNGRLIEGMPGVISDESGIGRRFVLVPAESSASGREIAVTIQDVRQIQLAKAALIAATKILMRKAGISRVERVVLTGAFGARFDWANAVSIGMFPDFGADIKVAANAAGMGAILGLLDGKIRREAIDIAKMVRSVELAEEPDFQMEYIRGMGFPPL